MLLSSVPSNRLRILSEPVSSAHQLCFVWAMLGIVHLKFATSECDLITINNIVVEHKIQIAISFACSFVIVGQQMKPDTNQHIEYELMFSRNFSDSRRWKSAKSFRMYIPYCACGEWTIEWCVPCTLYTVDSNTNASLYPLFPYPFQE